MIDKVKKAPHPDFIVRKPNKKIVGVFGIVTKEGFPITLTWVETRVVKRSKATPMHYYHKDLYDNMFSKW